MMSGSARARAAANRVNFLFAMVHLPWIWIVQPASGPVFRSLITARHEEVFCLPPFDGELSLPHLEDAVLPGGLDPAPSPACLIA
jgi:hypothetical protein